MNGAAFAACEVIEDDPLLDEDMVAGVKEGESTFNAFFGLSWLKLVFDNGSFCPGLSFNLKSSRLQGFAKRLCCCGLIEE